MLQATIFTSYKYVSVSAGGGPEPLADGAPGRGRAPAGEGGTRGPRTEAEPLQGVPQQQETGHRECRQPVDESIKNPPLLQEDDIWPATQPDLPQIQDIQVQCEKTSIRVNVKFDRPFYGMIFSKGFYSDPNCVHLAAGSGTITASFEIFLNSCGMTSSGNTETYGQVGYSTVGSMRLHKTEFQQ